MSRRAQRGQATVELALCLPLVALLLAAVIAVGGVAADQVRLWHAAREAARVAIVDPAPAKALAAAESSGLRPLTLKIDPPAAHRIQGKPLTVTVTYAPARKIPFAGAILSGVTLQARATMQIEAP